MITQDEIEELQNRASNARVNVSEYIRNKVFDDSISADDLRTMHIALMRFAEIYNELPEGNSRILFRERLQEASDVLANLYHLAGR